MSSSNNIIRTFEVIERLDLSAHNINIGASSNILEEGTRVTEEGLNYYYADISLILKYNGPIKHFKEVDTNDLSISCFRIRNRNKGSPIAHQLVRKLVTGDETRDVNEQYYLDNKLYDKPS